MSSSYTPNYALNQWSEDDRVLREEFNADNAKTDAALAELAQSLAGKASQDEVTGVKNVVATKADQSALNALSEAVDAKVDPSDLDALSATVSTKASQSALNSLSSSLSSLTTTVGTKASQTDLNSLKTTVNSKASQSDLNSLSSSLSSLTTTVGTKASQADLNTLSNTVAAKGNCQIELGTYTGNGATSRSLTFSSRPLAVIILASQWMLFSGTADAGNTTVSLRNSPQSNFTWSGNTLTWRHEYDVPTSALNASGTTYTYLAIYRKT